MVVPGITVLTVISVLMFALGANVREFSPQRSVMPNFIACDPVT